VLFDSEEDLPESELDELEDVLDALEESDEESLFLLSEVSRARLRVP
jgi:hypothetical protein